MQNSITNEEEKQAIQKKFVWLGLIDALPIVVLALAMQAKFNDNPIHPILESSANINLVFFIAGPIVALTWLYVIYLSFQIRKIDRRT